MVKAIFAAALAATASAHMCNLSPIQRGGVAGAGSVAAPACALGSKPPCGGMPAGAPVAAYFAGEQHHVCVFRVNVRARTAFFA